jgi:S1-C subfamily serine protease
LSKKRPGAKLELTVFRNGKTQKISVTLTEDPGDTL